MTLTKLIENQDNDKKYYKLRNSILVYQQSNHLRIYSLMDFKVLDYDVFDFVPELICLLNGEFSLEFIKNKLVTFNDFSIENLYSVIEQLESDKLIYVDYINTASSELSKRYDRQIRLFNEWHSAFPESTDNSILMQKKLNKSEISVIGAGGLGSWLLLSLVSSGIGKINVFDPDTVEISNLNRQVLYNTADIGRKKIDILVKKLASVNKTVIIEVFPFNIETKEQIIEYCKTSDVVVNCGDYPNVAELSDIISEGCMQLKIPHIVGGGYGGNLGIPGLTVIPNKTKSWSELRNYYKNHVDSHSGMELIKGSELVGGSMAAISGLVANFLALEIIKIILGLPLGFTNQLRELNLMTLEWRTEQFL